MRFIEISLDAPNCETFLNVFQLRGFVLIRDFQDYDQICNFVHLVFGFFFF